MNKKRFLIFVSSIILILVIAFLYVNNQSSFINLIPTKVCPEDGEGTDIYFEEKDLEHFEGSPWKGDLANSDYVVAFWDSGSCHNNEPPENLIRTEDSTLKEVSHSELRNFVKEYNEQCHGCLMVKHYGFPYFGEIRAADCPKGYTEPILFNGTRYTYGRCQKDSDDAFQACSSNDDCTYNCKFDWGEAEKLCPESLNNKGGSCPGIVGTCNPAEKSGPRSMYIPKKDFIEIF